MSQTRRSPSRRRSSRVDRPGLDVDNTVLVGSPGAGAGNDHASDLSGDVYVGSANDDVVSRLGDPTVAGLGNDPAGSDFGAHRFDVDDVSDDGFDMDDHTSSFDLRSTSLDNVGRIVVGNGDDIDRVDGRGDLDDTAWWTDQTVGRVTDPLVDAGSGAVDAAHDGLDAVGDVLERVPVTPVMPRPGWPF